MSDNLKAAENTWPAYQWISVEEHLPYHYPTGWSDYVLVLVNGDEWFKAAAFFSRDGLLYWENYETEKRFSPEQITHWMRIELP